MFDFSHEGRNRNLCTDASRFIKNESIQVLHEISDNPENRNCVITFDLLRFSLLSNYKAFKFLCTERFDFSCEGHKQTFETYRERFIWKNVQFGSLHKFNDSPKSPKSANNFLVSRFSNSNFSVMTVLISSTKISSKCIIFWELSWENLFYILVYEI